MKLISGGQTGADRAALDAWAALGLPTGGFAPKGWLTEKGSDPSLEKLGLTETDDPDYKYRTSLNVQASDLTIIFGRSSPGCNLTVSLCKQFHKFYLWFPYPETKHPMDMIVQEILNHLAIEPIDYLNVAGNRASKNPGIYPYVFRVITAVGRETK